MYAYLRVPDGRVLLVRRRTVGAAALWKDGNDKESRQHSSSTCQHVQYMKALLHAQRFAIVR